MDMVPYLNFNGQCQAAFKFYEKCLGGEIVAMIPHTGSPAAESVPAEWGDKIMHARLLYGDAALMGSDSPPGHYSAPKGFCVALQIKEPKEAERIFHLLGENGNVTMPIQETFWAVRFGMFVDQFGIPWMVNCGKGAEKAA